jgi:cytidine deaminase
MRAELTTEEQALLEEARGAATGAFAPYSHFRVGAALRSADGRVFRGANVESASYGLTMCAERVALFQAVIAAARPVAACAVSCVDAKPELGAAGRMPCGACRQLLAEHLAPDANVIVDGVGAFRIAELLPEAFRLG